MRTGWRPVLLVVVTALLTSLSWQALSDEPPAADKPHRVPVAIVDVAKVVNGGRDFQAEMDRIKLQIKEFEQQARDKQREIVKRLAEGEVDADKAGELTKQLEVEATLKKQEFLTAEARAYFRVYERVEKSVAQIARQRDIGLVLRYSGDAMKPDDRESVLRGINRSVVYSAVPDISDEVIASLNGEKQ